MKFIIPVALIVFIFPAMTFAQPVNCGEDVPSGSFSDSCKGCSVVSNCVFTCKRCKIARKNGISATWNYKVKKFDFSNCDKDICNSNGQLKCGC